MKADRLLHLFVVDADAGRLYWRNPPKSRAHLLGLEAGNRQPSRRGKFYWVVQIDKRKHKRGHLIFLAKHGRLPHPMLDHIDGNSLNDSADNIREATATQNAWNHKTRARRLQLPMGVRLIPHSGRYEARISCNKHQFHLGAFDTPEEAETVYRTKRKELFGDYS